MPFTYMLRCADGSLYVGSTRGDLAVRLSQHNDGVGARYTATRRPVTLLWSAEFELVTEAFALEKRVQNWSRAKRLALAEGRFADLPGLARRGGAASGLETGSAGAPPSSTPRGSPPATNQTDT
jgi:putative endonuclease